MQLFSSGHSRNRQCPFKSKSNSTHPTILGYITDCLGQTWAIQLAYRLLPRATTITAMPDTKSQETVLNIGRIESGMAILLTDDLEMFELPAHLLSPAIHNNGTAKVVRLVVTSAAELQAARHAEHMSLQREILKNFGNEPDSVTIANCLKVAFVSHTTALVSWPAWYQMAPPGITVHSLDGILRDESGGIIRRMEISPEEVTLKLTSLQPNTSYKLTLAFRTSAGRYSTVDLPLKTPPLEDLSCLKVSLDNVPSETINLLQSIGVQVVDFGVDTSLVISGRNQDELREGPDDGELLRTAKNGSIPIVGTEWVLACKESGKMQSVSNFYIE